jgi:NAD-dependent DNA ligase
MLLDCTTKGCLQKTEAKLDSNNNVICDECGNVIPNITRFTKKALKDLGQILRSRSKQPFQANCPNCNKSSSLFIEENKAYCKACNTQVQVTAAFLRGLKFYLDDLEKEKRQNNVEEKKVAPKKATPRKKKVKAKRA